MNMWRKIGKVSAVAALSVVLMANVAGCPQGWRSSVMDSVNDQLNDSLDGIVDGFIDDLIDAVTGATAD